MLCMHHWVLLWREVVHILHVAVVNCQPVSKSIEEEQKNKNIQQAGFPDGHPL